MLNPKKVIYFYSLQRSGHHAIIYWILHKICNVNNLQNVGGYLAGSLIYGDTYLEYLKKIYYVNNANYKYQIENVLEAEGAIVDSNTILMSNFEDKYIEDPIIDIKIVPQKIVIIRDFLNLLASRFKYKVLIPLSKKPKPKDQMVKDIINYIENDVPQSIRMWKNHFYYKNAIQISYNSWLLSKEYRTQISEKLNLNPVIDVTDYVPQHGGGSSFINRKLDDKNNYLNRFNLIKFPQKIKEIVLSDSELLSINKSYFNIDIEKKLLK